MNKNLFKAMAATVCVVVTSVSVFKAYNVSNQSEANMLLKENVEALSDPEIRSPCVSAIGGCLVNAVDAHGIPRLLSIWGMLPA